MEKPVSNRKDAFERALVEYGPRIRAGVHSLIQNREDAEDVIAEVNLALWTSLRGFDGRSSLGTFIYSVTNHKIKDHLRRKYRDADIRRTVVENAGAEPGRPAEADPAIKVEFLTQTELAVLRLIIRGMGNEEIARTLFRSVNTVRSHIKHIYAKLGAKTRAEAVYVFGRCAGK